MDNIPSKREVLLSQLLGRSIQALRTLLWGKSTNLVSQQTKFDKHNGTLAGCLTKLRKLQLSVPQFD